MGVALAYLTVNQHFATKKILDHGIQANCRITELTRHTWSRHDKLLPTCEFFDTTNKSHQLKAQNYYWPSPYKIGDTALVYYDQQDPANARLNLYAELWGGRDSGILMVMITLFLSGLMAWFI
jgi:hypothetical protein